MFVSVVPMKLVTIAGPLSDFDSVVYSCIINQQFHPEPAANIMKNVKLLHPFDQMNPYADMLRQAENLADKMSVPLDYRPFEKMDITPENSVQYFRTMDEKYISLMREQDELVQRISENERIIMQLNHILNVNVPLEEFFTVTYVKFRFGRMPRETYNSFMPHLNERSDLFFFTTSVERDWVYGMYMTPRSDTEKTDALFASLQFERIRISSRVHGTGGEAIKDIQTDSERAGFRLEEIKTDLRILASEQKEELLRHYSYIRFMNDSFNIRRYAAHTRESFYVLGWVPSPNYDEFTEHLSQYGNLTVVVVADEPEGVTEYQPPVKLKNPKIFKPFEPFLAMYGLPSYHELDPTPLMAITYTILFGIMFGDAGQGALLVIAGLLMYKLKGMWLGRIVCYAGLSSIVFGLFVYGSVFGFEDWLGGFKILDRPHEGQLISNGQLALRLAVFLGIGLLVVVIIANIINGIRQKNYTKMLFGPNGLAGLILYLSVISAILPLLGFTGTIIATELVMMLAALPLILVFLREPLSNLLAHRQATKTHGVSDFILENLFELIEVLLSYITNTISFLRVGAYAISHASMMNVVFMLAGGAEGGSPNIVVIIIGNLFVMAIEGMLVGIQVLRLEFYELFSRFYSGDGRPYSPIIIDYQSHHEKT